jgi:hypothetical protein
VDALVRLLVPAYMAQNFAALCLSQDAQFLADVKGGPSAVTAFAEGVKQRVTASLSEADAQKVRITAADSAQQVARQELQLLNRQQASGVNGPIKAWCERSARSFILEVLRRHEEKRQEFDKLLDEAKR